MPSAARIALSRAARRMLGVDQERTSVEEAARRAYTPTGPSIEELEWGIREFRAGRVSSESDPKAAGPSL